ncbi:unnamed protein product [Boreogadus saida]
MGLHIREQLSELAGLWSPGGPRHPQGPRSFIPLWPPEEKGEAPPLGPAPSLQLANTGDCVLPQTKLGQASRSVHTLSPPFTSTISSSFSYRSAHREVYTWLRLSLTGGQMLQHWPPAEDLEGAQRDGEPGTKAVSYNFSSDGGHRSAVGPRRVSGVKASISHSLVDIW